MTTKGLCQLMGNGDEAEIFRKELDILNKYNQLTGNNLEPFSPHHHDAPLKQAIA